MEKSVIWKIFFRPEPHCQWIWRSKDPETERWVTRFEVEDCLFIRDYLNNPDDKKIIYKEGIVRDLSEKII